MTRRDLLRLLLASAVAEAMDVERLLWVPKPIVTVPSGITLAEINEIVVQHVMPGVVDRFFKSSPLYEYLATRKVA